MVNSSDIQSLWFGRERFKHQQDIDLFHNHIAKCRYCFHEIPDQQQIIVTDWHRKTFATLTNVEMTSSPTASIYLCSKCDLMLKAFDEFRDAGGEVQQRYKKFVRNIDDILGRDSVIATKQHESRDEQGSEENMTSSSSRNVVNTVRSIATAQPLLRRTNRIMASTSQNKNSKLNFNASMINFTFDRFDGSEPSLAKTKKKKTQQLECVWCEKFCLSKTGLTLHQRAKHPSEMMLRAAPVGLSATIAIRKETLTQPVRSCVSSSIRKSRTCKKT